MRDTRVAPSRIRPRSLAAVALTAVLVCLGAWLARPAPAAADCAPGSNCLTGYATNRGGTTLTPFDIGSNQPLPDVNDNLNDPGPIAITPDGKDAYVANTCNVSDGGDGNLTDSVLGSGLFDTFPVTPGACFTALAVSPNRNANGDGGYTMWAATPGSAVFPVDTSDHSVGTAIVLPDPCPSSGCVGAQIEDGIDDIALSPDGDTLYILFTQSTIEGDGSSSSHTYVVPYDLTTPTPTPGFQIGLDGADLQGSSIAVSPDGSTVYATANSCGEFDLRCTISPFYSFPTSNPPHTATTSIATHLAAAGQITISPDGGTAFIAESDVILVPGSSVAVVDLNQSPMQIITHITYTPMPQLTAVTPDGTELYTGFFYNGGVAPVREVTGVDTATNEPNVTVPITGEAAEGIAITPTQPPTAQLTVNAAVAGKASILDASASSVPCTHVVCSTITGYHWTFGDGSPGENTTTPTTTHRYGGPGPYTASVTETSSQGVSTDAVFTGHQMLTNGGSSAQTSDTFSLPTLSTSASPMVPPGGSVTDTALLTGSASENGPIAFSLYGPGDPTCSGAPVFTDTVTATGAGTYTSGAFTPASLGTYHWTATFTPANGDPAQQGHCGDAGESVTVGKAIPSIATSASPAVTIGGRVHDTATVIGGQSPTGSVTFTLYGPNDLSCTAAPVDTETVPLGTDGTAASPSLTPPTAGVYVWGASYSGDASNAPVTGSCGGASESVNVARATPGLTTAATANVALGGQIDDTATLTGGHRPTGTITFRLAGAGDATCSAAPVFTSVVSAADGSVPSGPFAPLATGEYRWQASYSGDVNNDPVTGSCNVDHETSTVTPAAPPPPPPTTPPPPPPTTPPTSPTSPPTSPTSPPAAPPGTLTPSADVSVTLGGPARGIIGRAATYLVTVANHGPDTARSVTLTDAFTGRVRVTTTTGATCTSTAVCSVPQLAPGGEARVRVTVIPARAGRVTLTSTVHSATADPRLADNRASRTVTIAAATPPARTPGPAHVTMTIHALPAQASAARVRTLHVEPNRTFSYQVALHVTGTVAAEGLRVCDRLPARLTLASKPRTAQLGGGQVCWSIRRLAPRARRALTLHVQATRSTQTGTVANTIVMRGVNVRRAAATARVVVAGVPPRPGGVTG